MEWEKERIVREKLEEDGKEREDLFVIRNILFGVRLSGSCSIGQDDVEIVHEPFRSGVGELSGICWWRVGHGEAAAAGDDGAGDSFRA